MPVSIIEQYAELLASFEGQTFQDEVCARLAAVIAGFQPIPARPQGDGGLDAFSHGGRRGYCCYGLEHDAFKTSNERATAMVDKFAADLRRLLEVDTRGQSSLWHKENKELGEILPAGVRLERIDLIANWFGNSKIAGRILTRLSRYSQFSNCRFVCPDVAVRVLGPKELANEHAVDESTLARATIRTFMVRIQERAAVVSVPQNDFDRKMSSLERMRPESSGTLATLAESLRDAWRMALAFEYELGDTLPDQHRALEHGRAQIRRRITQMALAVLTPWDLLRAAPSEISSILRSHFGESYGPLVDDIANGEAARLIGECPIDWPEAPHHA